MAVWGWGGSVGRGKGLWGGCGAVWVCSPVCATALQEEIQEVKKEGNLEELFRALDAIVEESRGCEEPAWYGGGRGGLGWGGGAERL